MNKITTTVSVKMAFTLLATPGYSSPVFKSAVKVVSNRLRLGNKNNLYLTIKQIFYLKFICSFPLLKVWFKAKSEALPETINDLLKFGQSGSSLLKNRFLTIVRDDAGKVGLSGLIWAKA